MRTLIKALLATSILVSGAALAHAADAIDEIPQAPESQDYGTPASTGWDGAYIGGTGTYQWGNVDPGHENGATGLGAGLYGGYNVQNGQVVFGGEADVNYSGVDKTVNNVNTKENLNGTIRGRVGYDLNPALVYGTAGIAVGNITSKDATSSDTKTMYGLTVGAGLETKITDQVTARTEYRYTNYADQTFGLKSGNVDRGFADHSVRVGLGVRF